MDFFPCRLCPNQCDPVFDRVVVSYLIAGHTRVMWELLPSFIDAGPLTFQLQIGTTANPDANDWQDVGAPVTDQYFAIDGEQRVFGKQNWSYYRVLLTTGQGTYLSEPTGLLGTLAVRDWLKARNLIRRKKTTFRLGEGQDGYLLKRRVTGQRCRVCLDFQTNETRQGEDCPSCYGTGFECGYFYPMSCVWANISPRTRRTSIDGQQRATVNDMVTQAQMLMTDLLMEDDVWVAKHSDDRYYAHRVQHTAEVRGMPVLAVVELRPIPYSSPIYGIAIPDQLAALGA